MAWSQYSYYGPPYYHYDPRQPRYGEQQIDLTTPLSHSSPPLFHCGSEPTSIQQNEPGNERELDIRYRYTYWLKIFNPDKRSKFAVEKFRRFEKFKTPQELRECLLTDFGDLVSDGDEFEVGYSKGRGSAKVWIKDSGVYVSFVWQRSGNYSLA